MTDHTHYSTITNNMFSPVIFLSLAIAVTAVVFEPDCARVTYSNGIGFVQGPECQVYYMCIKSPLFDLLYTEGSHNITNDLYRWHVLCCAEGLAWDDDHLTCKRDPSCNDPRDRCPNATTTTDTPCPHKADQDDDTKYFTSTHEQMMCPSDQVWNQEYCTCISKGAHQAPCEKILHYKFNQTYDSHSCNNFAVGEPHGSAYLTENMLCLNGTGEYLAIPFLSNWFAWNPVARTFTLCFWLRAKEGQSAGVFSYASNLLEIWLDNGELVGNLGGTVVRTGEFPSNDDWSKVCIVFNNGKYMLYYNTNLRGEGMLPNPWPVNSHKAATVGAVEGKPTLNGYFDDVCLWTSALSAEEIEDCFADGPSSVDSIEAQSVPMR